MLNKQNIIWETIASTGWKCFDPSLLMDQANLYDFIDT